MGGPTRDPGDDDNDRRPLGPRGWFKNGVLAEREEGSRVSETPNPSASLASATMAAGLLSIRASRIRPTGMA